MRQVIISLLIITTLIVNSIIPINKYRYIVDEDIVLIDETDVITNEDYASNFYSYASPECIKDYKKDFPLTFSKAVNVVGVVKDYYSERTIAGAKISVEGYTAVTDDNGRFQIRNLPAGKYEWIITAEGYYTASYKNYRVCFEDKTDIFTFFISDTESINKNKDEIQTDATHNHDNCIDETKLSEQFRSIPSVDSTISVYYNGTVRNVGRQVYIYTVVSSELYSSDIYSGAGLTSSQINQLFVAQAVVANTFLEYSLRVYSNHSGSGYKVCATSCCQVYDPTCISLTAVNATAEIFYYAGGIRRTNILMYHPDSSTYQYIYGAFFSSCGDAGTITVTGQPALQAVTCSDLFTGYGGHRKGMCQNGAAKMAKNGSTTSAILNHYYTDCVMAACPLN